MRLVKEEAGFSVFSVGGYVVAAILFSVVLIASANFDRRQRDFKLYFQMDESELQVKALVQPMVLSRLIGLENTARGDSLAVRSILEESPALTPDAVKDQLRRLKNAEKNEKDAWFHWWRACKAAKYEDLIEVCKTTP